MKITNNRTGARLAAVAFGLTAGCANAPTYAQTGQVTPAPSPVVAPAPLAPPTGITAPLGGENGSTPLAPATATGAASAVVPDDYRLDTGDLVQVEVMRHGDVSRSVRLLADAQIRLPRLSGPIAARGKTCAQLAGEIAAKLKTDGKLRLVPNAVSVSVGDMRMHRIYIRGNAGRSGDFDLKNDWRITEVVAVIGGVATPERVTARVLHQGNSQPVSFNLANALANPDSADNLYLREGDTITLDMPRQKRFVVAGEGPRGLHEIDERLGLRRTLTQLGFTTNGASGDLRHAHLYRHETPADPNSPQTDIPVDLFTLLTSDSAPEIPLQDNDTLEIPVSQDFITIWGETSAPRKYLLPQDRPTYLADLMSLGGTSGRAKIDNIKIFRPSEWKEKDANGNPKARSFKFGKFIANADASQNPQIKPGDMVVVPAVNRPDVIGSIWQTWGLFGIVQALVPGTRIR